MLKLGFIIEGPIEIRYWGREVSSAEKDALSKEYSNESEIEILDFYEEFFNGPVVKQPRDLVESGLKINYYFPEEEAPEQVGPERVIDLSRINVVIGRVPRKKCETGRVFIAGGEIRNGFREIRHFASGFLPPMKPEDLTLFIDDLSDFGYEGYILTDMRYIRYSTSYSESDFRPGRRLPTHILIE